MEIRDDIYPHFRGPERKKLLEKEVALVSKAFESFGSTEDVVKYMNNLSDPKIAELFLETGRFYFSARFHHCPRCGKRFDVCPNGKCNRPFEMPAHVALIMMISIMEKLSHGLVSYKDFYDWVIGRRIRRQYQTKLDSGEIKTYRELAESLRDEYRGEYGSSTKITQVFKRFLHKDEKIEFIRSIRYPVRVPDLPPRLPDIGRITKANLEEHFQEIQKEGYLVFETDEDLKRYVEEKDLKIVPQALPDCFDKQHYWKCYSRDSYGHGYGYCHFSLFEVHCRLVQDERLLDRYFEKTVKTIYDWRSEFVHDAHLPPIGEIADAVLDFYERKKKCVVVEINTRKLRPTFARIFKRYFDSFQVKGEWALT